MARPKGSKNRNYPVLTLQEALEVPKAIQDDASGVQVGRLTLAELMNRSPSSSIFGDLVGSSRGYNLTTGGIRAEQFELTDLGQRATSDDEATQQQAKREAVLKVEPFAAFLTFFKNRKVPAPGPFKEYLVNNASVPPDRAEDCMNHILADARFVGFLRPLMDPCAPSQGTARLESSIIRSRRRPKMAKKPRMSRTSRTMVRPQGRT
jgi:hypothetical protein